MTERYKIEITKLVSGTRKVTKNFVTSKKFAGKVKEDTYSSKDPIYDEQYEAKEVDEAWERTQEVLTQEVDTLNLSAVIKAINGI